MKQLKNVLLIGAGNIGSRHLQGLAKVKFPLNISAVDPSVYSLKVAEERLKQIPGFTKHRVSFKTDLSEVPGTIDLAIIATSSNIRRKVVESLLNQTVVKNIILEKLLFQKQDDYLVISKLFKKKKVNAWVNCSMRVTPFYRNLKSQFRGKRIVYTLTGTRFGIATQAIHFIDHMAYLLDSYDFEIDTSLLNKRSLKSKRQGFIELTGTLKVSFKNGSIGIFADFKDGDAPIVAQITSDSFQAIANESNRETFILKSPDWKMQKSKDPLLFQSDMTNKIAEEILEINACNLPTYEQSAKIHLKLLGSLLMFLNSTSGKKYDYYPFT